MNKKETCDLSELLNKEFLNYSGNVKIYKHNKYGTIYSVQNMQVDEPKKWYDKTGKLLHVSPFVWKSNKKYDTLNNSEQSWINDVIFIKECTNNKQRYKINY